MADQFVSDIHFKAQYAAYIIRSPVESGILNHIRTTSLPEGYAVYTAQHIPAALHLDILGSSIPIFVQDKICYKGQALGILVGSGFSIPEEVKKSVQIDIDPLPPQESEQYAVAGGNSRTEDFRQTTGTQARNIQPDNNGISENSMQQTPFFPYPVIARAQRASNSKSGETIDHIFETADSVIYSSLTFDFRTYYRTEPLGVVVQPDGENIHIYAPTQWARGMQQAVAHCLGITPNSIIVHPTAQGETKNELLWYPTLLACQCAVAVFHTKKTVRLTLTSDEIGMAAPKTPAVQITHKSAISVNHTITAQSVFILIYSGAFSPLITKMLAQMVHSALGAYQSPAFRIEALAVRTPHGITDIFENWGESFTGNALEHHISTIIEKKDFEPDTWRLQTMTAESRNQFLPLFTLLKKQSDFLRKETAYRVFNRHATTDIQKIRGMGFAAGFQYNTCPLACTCSVDITLQVDNRLSVKAAPANLLLRKIIIQLITAALDIPEADIIFTGLTTADMNPCGPASAAYLFTFIPLLIEQAVHELQELRFRNPLPLHVCKQHRSTGFEAIPYVRHTNSTGNAPSANDLCNAVFLQPEYSTAPAACIIELEMDTVCYKLNIRGIWFSAYCGTQYDKCTIQYALQKYIAAAAKQTFTSTSAKNIPFHFVPPNHIPPATLSLLNTGTHLHTALTAPSNIIPAAYLSALNQILISTPAHADQLPLFPHALFSIIERNIFVNDCTLYT